MAGHVFNLAQICPNPKILPLLPHNHLANCCLQQCQYLQSASSSSYHARVCIYMCTLYIAIKQWPKVISELEFHLTECELDLNLIDL